MPDETPRQSFQRRMSAGDASLRLYAILDAESCRRRGLMLLDVARAWRDAGIQLVQYRYKLADRDTLLRNADQLRRIFPRGETFLLLNDFPELVDACCFDGAHVGQQDATMNAARASIGLGCILGVSTHRPEQALKASTEDVDYIAVGPVFATGSKKDAEPVIGLLGVQAARVATRKPLVAIGGIGAALSREVLNAGADAVAMISALLDGDLRQAATALL